LNVVFFAFSDAVSGERRKAQDGGMADMQVFSFGCISRMCFCDWYQKHLL